MPRLTPYPLQWPNGWKRHEAWERKKGHFQGSWKAAVKEFQETVKIIGGKEPIINTGHQAVSMNAFIDYLTMDPYIAFPEVVVSFLRYRRSSSDGRLEEREIIIPCDRWPRLRDNLRAITCSLQALEKVKYWGIGEMMERAFDAYELPALPAPKCWWDILEIEMREAPTLEAMRVYLTKEKINAHWREKVKKLHPDIGGYHEQMAELNNARDQALEELGWK